MRVFGSVHVGDVLNCDIGKSPNVAVEHLEEFVEGKTVRNLSV